MINLFNKYEPILNELKQIQKIQAIIIFGSYSENRENINSDLDICIILEKTQNYEQIKEEILTYSSSELDISIFDDLPLPLQYKIVESGKIFYLKKDYYFNKIKFAIRNQYFDFKPYLEKAYKKRGYLIEI